MADILSHMGIALLAFAGALVVEHCRVWLLSRILFWRRKSNLMGTYSTNWEVTSPVPALGPDGAPIARASLQDLARVEWASGSYVTGTASNASYGDYLFQGRVAGDALTLTYRSKEKRLEAHLGAIMLRLQPDGSLVGHWMQNKPDQATAYVGTTTWKKRPT